MIEVTFAARKSGTHGTPGTLQTRTYEDAKSITHLPQVGDEIIIQFGEVGEQNATFKVENIICAF